MRVFVQITLSIIFAMAFVMAQEQPGSTVKEKQAELPAASGTPEPQIAPELLPESTILPAAPPDLRLPAPIGPLPAEGSLRQAPVPKVHLSPEEEARIRVRLSALRAAAERTSRAVYLLKLADGALSDEAKREFMRAYDHTICMEMRRLDPKITEAINEYERSQIRGLAQGPSRLVLASHRPQRIDRRHRIRTTDR
jgi:hypothetical protein